MHSKVLIFNSHFESTEILRYTDDTTSYLDLKMLQILLFKPLCSHKIFL